MHPLWLRTLQLYPADTSCRSSSTRSGTLHFPELRHCQWKIATSYRAILTRVYGFSACLRMWSIRFLFRFWRGNMWERRNDVSGSDSRSITGKLESVHRKSPGESTTHCTKRYNIHPPRHSLPSHHHQYSQRKCHT